MHRTPDLALVSVELRLHLLSTRDLQSLIPSFRAERDFANEVVVVSDRQGVSALSLVVIHPQLDLCWPSSLHLLKIFERQKIPYHQDVKALRGPVQLHTASCRVRAHDSLHAPPLLVFAAMIVYLKRFTVLAKSDDVRHKAQSILDSIRDRVPL